MWWITITFTFCSVQFSRSVVSDSLRPHESKNARPPCPSPTPGVYSDPCPSSQWCHPVISSSVIPFSSCPLKKDILVSMQNLLFDHFQFALIHGPNIPGSYATLLFTASDFTSITSHIHNRMLFLLWFISSFFQELFLHWFPVAYWAPIGLGSSSFSGDVQGSLACCSPRGHKELNMTEWPNWTDGYKTFYRHVTTQWHPLTFLIYSKNQAYFIYFYFFYQAYFKESESESRSIVSDPLWPIDYSPWNSPGQNTGVGSLSPLQGIFLTQGSNPGLPYCRCILYQLSHKGSPRILEWVAYPFSSGSFQPRSGTWSPALQVDSLPTELSGKLF